MFHFPRGRCWFCWIHFFFFLVVQLNGVNWTSIHTKSRNKMKIENSFEKAISIGIQSFDLNRRTWWWNCFATSKSRECPQHYDGRPLACNDDALNHKAWQCPVVKHRGQSTIIGLECWFWCVSIRYSEHGCTIIPLCKCVCQSNLFVFSVPIIGHRGTW